MNRAAEMYSRSRRLSVRPRTTRAVIIQPKIVSSGMSQSQVRLARNGLRMASSRNDGRTSSRSMTHTMPMSANLPKYPATEPAMADSTVVSSAVNRPMISDLRRPIMVRAKMSRPRESVPNQWLPVGPCRIEFTSGVV